MTDLSHPLIVTCARGTERAVRHELKVLGATDLKSGAGAVYGRGTPKVIAEANVFLRTASRVLMGLTEVEAHDEPGLVEALTGYAFEELFGRGTTFAVQAHLKDAPLTHSHHAALLVKDAICDRLRDKGLQRPDVDTRQPHLRFFLYWKGSEAALSLDTSGRALHERGYRRPGGEAPMRETLAAAILGMGHADVRVPFHDPCCGTGTLGIEQAWRVMKRAPGAGRPFGIDHWQDDRLGLWRPLKHARARARDEQIGLGSPIVLSDWHPAAIEACRANVEAAGLTGKVAIEQVDARKATYDEGTTVCSNLPFGERLAKNTLQMEGFYRTLGERLGALGGSRLLLFTSHERTEYLLNLGRPTKRWSLYSGALKAMLRRWDVPLGEDPAEVDREHSGAS